MKKSLAISLVLLFFTGCIKKNTINNITPELIVEFAKQDSIDKAAILFKSLYEKDPMLVSDPMIRVLIANVVGIEPYRPVRIRKEASASPRFWKHHRVVFQEINAGKGLISWTDISGDTLKRLYVPESDDVSGWTPVSAGDSGVIFYKMNTKDTTTDIVFISENGTMHNILTKQKGLDDFDYSPITNQLLLNKYLVSEGDEEIYLYDLKSGKETRLTDNISNETEPVFSKDGKKIACITDSLLFKNIATVGKTGREGLKLLTFTPYNKYSPMMVNDTLLLFSASTGKFETDIFMQDLKRKVVYRLTQRHGQNWNADMSDDGAWIVFQSTRDTTFGIYLISIFQPIGEDSLYKEVKKYLKNKKEKQ